MNDSLVALFYFFLDLHVRYVLHVFEIDVCLLDGDELVLEKYNMVSVVLRFALVTPRHLTLVACEHDLTPMVQRAVRFLYELVTMLRLL